jgi:hypothetical protein
MLLYVPADRLGNQPTSIPVILWLASGPLDNTALTRSQDPRGFVRSRFSNGARIGWHFFIQWDWRYCRCYTISAWRST